MGVEFTDPAMRKRAEFVFHTAPGMEGDAVADLSWEGIGAALDGLLVGRGRLCWCCHVVVVRSVRDVNGCLKRSK